MSNLEKKRKELHEFLKEHEALDKKIALLLEQGQYDQILVQRMKRRKLQLKDKILYLQELLCDDIIA